MSQYSTDTSVSSSSQAPDAVSRRAYEIWEREGRPEGCDLKHWLQAEQELSSDAAAPQKNPASAAVRHTGTNPRPLQSMRAVQASSRPPKRNSGAPFITEKNGVTGNSSASMTGGNSAAKRKPASAPMM